MAYYNRAFYEETKFLQPCGGACFEKIRGDIPVRHSGIYRCDACGYEIIKIQPDRLPSYPLCKDHEPVPDDDPEKGQFFRPANPMGLVTWRLVILVKNKTEQ
jgi:hypothetical protein